jgi:hypothetical protein
LSEKKGLTGMIHREMISMRGLQIVAGTLLGVAAIGAVYAQDAEKPAYLNPNLPAEQRAADLVRARFRGLA